MFPQYAAELATPKASTAHLNRFSNIDRITSNLGMLAGFIKQNYKRSPDVERLFRTRNRNPLMTMFRGADKHLQSAANALLEREYAQALIFLIEMAEQLPTSISKEEKDFEDYLALQFNLSSMMRDGIVAIIMHTYLKNNHPDGYTIEELEAAYNYLMQRTADMFRQVLNILNIESSISVEREGYPRFVTALAYPVDN